MEKNIPVLRPLLPKAHDISPYLYTIDENRWYSNFGPLVKDFEKRLEQFFSQGERTIVTTANGTAALTNTLRSMNLPRNSYCLLPSWTFIAAPAAILAAGLVPYFIDVDENSWSLTPEKVKEIIPHVEGNIGAVLYVAPFGSVPMTKDWEEFVSSTGIPVLVDAAASFDAISKYPEILSEKIPVIISLHATKAFGVGEGGIVLCKNPGFISRVQEMSNFGFSNVREISVSGTNGKMNEYNAAVGLAELNKWDVKLKKWQQVTKYYIECLNEIGVSHRLSENWVTSTCNVRIKHNVSAVMDELLSKGIETKRWWQGGCHKQPAYEKFAKINLPVTEKLANSVLGLPFSVDMQLEDVEYVCNLLKESFRSIQPIEQAAFAY